MKITQRFLILSSIVLVLLLGGGDVAQAQPSITSITPNPIIRPIITYPLSEVSITITGNNLANTAIVSMFVGPDEHLCVFVEGNSTVLTCRVNAPVSGISYVTVQVYGVVSAPYTNLPIYDPIPKCLSPAGIPVEWWFARKLPTSKYYMYFSSAEPNGTFMSSVFLEDDTSCLGRTLNVIPDSSTYGTGYLLYNDYPIYDDYAYVQFAKSANGTSFNPALGLKGKGIVAIHQLAPTQHGFAPGFMIKHSLNGFPIPIRWANTFKKPKGYPGSWYPSNTHTSVPVVSSSTGEGFLCTSFSDFQSFSQPIASTYPFVYRESFTPIIPKFNTMLTPIINQSTPQSNTTNVMSTSSTVLVGGYKSNIWQDSNLLPLNITQPLNYPKPVPSTIVTETIYPQSFNITPSSLSQFRSSMENCIIGFGSNVLCLGDASSDTLMGGGNILCIRDPTAATAIQFFGNTIFRRTPTSCINTVTCNTQEQLIIPMYSQQFTVMMSTLLNSQFTDSLLPNTNIETVCSGCSALHTNYQPTDSKGVTTLTNDNSPTILLTLSSNGTINSTLVRITNIFDGLDVQLIITNTSNDHVLTPVPGQLVGQDNLVLVYKTLMEIARVRPLLVNAPILSSPLNLSIDTTTGMATLNQRASTAFSYTSLCIDNLYRAVAFDILLNLNGNISSVLPPSLLYNINGLASASSQVIIPSLVNIIAIQLRKQLFNIDNSVLSNCLVDIDIEQYSSTRVVRHNGPKSEGWTTAYLLDLLDLHPDDDIEPLQRRLPYQDEPSLLAPLPNHLLVKAIRSFPFPTNSDIFTFTNHISRASMTNDLLMYDNIIDCPSKCIVTTPPLPTPSANYSDMFLSKGICQSTLDRTDMEEIEEYLKEWSSDVAQSPLSNQALNFLYSTTFINMFKSSDFLEALFSIGDVSMCEINLDNDYPVTPNGLGIITKMISSQLGVSNLVLQSNELRVYWTKNVDSIIDQGLAIITWQDKICAFSPSNQTSAADGSLLYLCPSGPTITSISGTSGNTMNALNTITITGRQLNLADSEVKVGNKVCVVQSSTLTSHVCIVGTGLGDQPITYKSTTSKLAPEIPIAKWEYKFNAPVITSVSPTTGLNPIGGTLVTITGKNFFSQSPPILTDASVLLDGIYFNVLSATASSTQESIVFDPNGTGVDSIGVLSGGKLSTNLPNSVTVTFAPPIITAAYPLSSPTEGGVAITIEGNNFGLVSNDHPIQIIIGDTPCEASYRISNTMAVCESSVKSMGSQPIGVDVDGQVYTSNINLVYDPSVILQIVYPPIPTASNTSLVWFTGTNLGLFSEAYPFEQFIDGNIPIQCDDDSDNCYRNKTYYDSNGVEIPVPTNPFWQGPDIYDPYVALNTSYRTTVDFECLVCYVIPGIGKDIHISSRAYRVYEVNSTDGFAYIPPTMSNLSVLSSPTDGGSPLTIIGTQFVPNEYVFPYQTNPDVLLDGPISYSNVTFGPNVATNINFFNSTTIYANVPPGIGTGIPVNLYIGYQGLTNPTAYKFYYHPPHVISTNSSNTGGEIITITGINFVPTGVEPLDSNVTVSGRLCSPITWQDSKTIICNAPYGIGLQNPMSVVVGNQTATFTMNYNPPTLDLAYHGGPPTGNFWITVTGNNFVPEEMAASINSGPIDPNKNYISIHGKKCVQTMWIAYSQAACLVPPGSGIGLNILVNVGGLNTAFNNYFSYEEETTVVTLLPIIGFTLGGVTADGGNSAGQTSTTGVDPSTTGPSSSSPTTGGGLPPIISSNITSGGSTTNYPSTGSSTTNGQLLGTVMGFVFRDSNHNNWYDSGEYAFANVLITLVHNLPNGQQFNRSCLTDKYGQYYFGGLYQGDYIITLGGLIIGYYAPYVPVQANVVIRGETVRRDVAVWRDDYVPTSTTTSATTTTSSATTGGATGNGIIKGYFWLDTNGNGVWDNGELPISDLKLLVLGDIPVNWVRTCYTGDDGSWLIPNLPIGNYYLEIAQGVHTPYWVYNIPYLFQVTDENQVIYRNFSYTKVPPPSMGVIGTGPNPPGTSILKGDIWMDSNSDGVYNYGDHLIENMIVVITGDNPVPVTPATSNQGRFFAYLAPGNYILNTMYPVNPPFYANGVQYSFTISGDGIELWHNITITSTPLPSSTTTTTSLSTTGTTSTTTTTSTTSSTTGTGVSTTSSSSTGASGFGTIIGYVWMDTNKDDIFDSNEYANADLDIRIWGGSENRITSTNNQGRYSQSQLPVGTYTLDIIQGVYNPYYVDNIPYVFQITFDGEIVYRNISYKTI